jgi:hypothetical protein
MAPDDLDVRETIARIDRALAAHDRARPEHDRPHQEMAPWLVVASGMIIGAASLAAGATLFAAGGAAVGHWVVVIAGNPAAIAAALADSSCGWCGTCRYTSGLSRTAVWILDMGWTPWMWRELSH